MRRNLQDVIMGVGATQFRGESQVTGKDLLKTSQSHAHPRMASNHMERVDPHPTVLCDRVKTAFRFGLE
jgi:hypothetical protein